MREIWSYFLESFLPKYFSYQFLKFATIKQCRVFCHILQLSEAQIMHCFLSHTPAIWSTEHALCACNYHVYLLILLLCPHILLWTLLTHDLEQFALCAWGQHFFASKKSADDVGFPVKCTGLKFLHAGHNYVILCYMCLTLNCCRGKGLIFYLTLQGSVVVTRVTRFYISNKTPPPVSVFMVCMLLNNRDFPYVAVSIWFCSEDGLYLWCVWTQHLCVVQVSI